MAWSSCLDRLWLMERMSRMRTEYADHAFHSGQAGSDPVRLFREWFDDASSRPTVYEPNAMTLATVAIADGSPSAAVPSARMVLLKEVDAPRAAFVLYTNLQSRKAREALGCRHAALTWWWPGDPARQVRVVGHVEQVDDTASDRYFATRPTDARIAAAASEQSRAIAARDVLDEHVAFQATTGDHRRPESWGGLRVVADEIEFWQGRSARLHDRITFLRLADGQPGAAIRSRAAVDAGGGDDRMRAAGVEVVDAHDTRWLRVRLAP